MNNQANNSFKRVDNNHPLDLYIGTDELSRSTLFLISDKEPQILISSEIITVLIGKRRDDKWGLSFTLIDNKFEDLFASFCKDIVESSRSLTNSDNGSVFICSRYTKWQNMLTKLNGNTLSLRAIKGIMGELVFLKKYLIPKYGQEIALNSWIGPDRANQDFVCEDSWYEVKSTFNGSASIKISSIEQLDMSQPGSLVIVYFDKSSSVGANKITLNSIVKEVLDLLSSEEMRHKLSGILLNLGYYHKPEYNEPVLVYTKTESYLVDNKFPCIRRNGLPKAIINTKYELSISSISKFANKL